MRRYRIACLAVSLMVLTILGSSAVAQTTAELKQARTAWKTGRALFGKGNYWAARVQFEKGYGLSHKGGFLYNMGECERLMGHKVVAHGLYLRYLHDYPKGKHRGEVQRQCQALHAGPCLSSPTPAKARPGGPDAPAKVRPGGLDASAKALPGGPGKASSGKPDLTPPQSMPATSFAATGPSLHAKPRASSPWYMHWGVWTAVGVAVVAGSVTAIVLATRPSDGANPGGDWQVTYK